jgi:NAD(P)-dependent dehydrogenase (short-subunit alcohol dehydrogenase family)
MRKFRSMSRATCLSIAGAAGVAFGLRRGLAPRFFRNKVVVITGGSRGLGLVLAREAARHGAHLAICARDSAEVERAIAEFSAQGMPILGAACDVSDEAQARSFIRAALGRFGRIDVLINVAGIIQIGPLDSMGVADFRSAMETNFFGLLHTSLAVLPHMRARHAGRIVNICSIGGALAVPHLAPYSASKFAAVGFSEGLAAESARHGISVTTVLPGVMRTGSHVNALVKGQREKEGAWFSLTASLPLTSSSAKRAARKILRACALKTRVIYIGAGMKLAHVANTVAPGVMSRLIGLASRLLPEPGGAGPGDAAEPVWQHRAAYSHGKLGDRAARENNELPWTP